MEVLFLIVFFTVIFPEIKKRAEGTPRRRSFTDSGARVTMPVQSAPAQKTSDGLSGRLAAGIAAGVAGAGFTAVMAMCLLSGISNHAALIHVPGGWPYLLGNAGLYAVLGALGVAVSRAGFRLAERVRSCRLYRAAIGGRDTCPLEELMRAAGRGKTAVTGELRELVRRGYFPGGVVDNKAGAFYLSAAARDAARAAQAAAGEEPEQKRKKGERSDAAAKLAAQGEEFFAAFDAEAAQLAEGPVKDDAAEVRRTAAAIFDWLAEHPARTADVQRFCNYYLPTVQKLLKMYNDAAVNAGLSESAASITQEVAGAMGPIRRAFARLLDELVSDAAVDVSAEIAAMEAVMAQDGLADGALRADQPPDGDE